uniref:Transmembrane protein 8B n=1 Tax=Hirondellea gigas TaxID=1518452 RepID=A0A6A7G2I8_9CRUS
MKEKSLRWLSKQSSLFTTLLFSVLCIPASATIQSAYDGRMGVSREVMAGRQLYVYTAYKDMQIFHFTIPPLTSKVTFSFTANDTEACDPRNVSMYLTPGSYPVVAAEGEQFPSGLWVDRGVAVYPVQLVSDDVPVLHNVVAPVPGPWFMAGAVMEDSNRITQAGLVPSCQSWVRIEATYHQDVSVITILPSLADQPQPSTLVTLTKDTYYRFYVGTYGFTTTVSLTNCSGKSSDFVTDFDNLTMDYNTYDNSSAGNETYEREASAAAAAALCPVVLELTPLSLSHHSSNHSTIVNCSQPRPAGDDNNKDELYEWSTSANNTDGDAVYSRGDTFNSRARNDTYDNATQFSSTATHSPESESRLLQSLLHPPQPLLSETSKSPTLSTSSSTSPPASMLASQSENGEVGAWPTRPSLSGCGVVAMVMEDAWHYIKLQPLEEEVTLELSVSLQLCGPCQEKMSSDDDVSSKLSFSSNYTDDSNNTSDNSSIKSNDIDNNITSNSTSDSGAVLPIKDIDAAAVDESNSNFNVATDDIIADKLLDAKIIEETNLSGTDDNIDAIVNDIDKNINLNINDNSIDNGLLDDIIDGGDIYYNNNSSNNSSSEEEGFEKLLPEAGSAITDSKCWNRHDLVRKTFSGNFVFEYDLSPNSNGSVPLLVNISTATPTLLAFALTPFMDLGGTLSVELALYPFLNTSVHQYRLSGCLSSGLRTTPRHDRPCKHGYTMHLNTSSGSGSSLDNVAAAVLIPYPDPGPWYLSIAAACYRHVNTTDTSNNNNSSSNATVSEQVVEEVSCNVLEVTAIFSVSSASCIHGKCGKYGSCYQLIYDGYIFSTCVCDAGYRGWACNDGSEATADWVLLLATLLLTLSNLAFLPAVVLAILRRHYTEALVYTFTMMFSTLYHACDQQTYNWCFMRLNVGVLQFCDFYSAILAFWVTLIAMADVPATIYSLLHMAGAVMVALGVEYDRTGLWVFVVPAASAFLVMAASWSLHSHATGTCYPPRRYWLGCLLPGTLLATTGFVCYAFLETHDNYQYVHSAWHVTMALSILCLLPPRRKRNIGGKLLMSDTSDCVAGCGDNEQINGTIVL